MIPSDGTSQFESDMYQNVLNMGPAYAMYSSTFGNPNFVIQPATPGEVQGGFPTVGYVGVEAVLWAQAASNPMVSSVNVLSGQTIGQQVTAGSTVNNDSTGTPRSLTGTQQQ